MAQDSLHLRFESLEGDELTIRHGEAEPIHTPGPLQLSGNFEAPAQFVSKRYNSERRLLDQHDANVCHVIFDKTNLSITLVAGEQAHDTITVHGSLKPHPFLQSLKINSGLHTTDALLKLVRHKAHYFENREQYRKLVASLQHVDVKTDTRTVKADNRAGQTENSHLVSAQTPLAGQQIHFYVPLFEGGEKSTVEVSLEVEPSNGSVLVGLFSETFEEFWDTAVDARFGEYEETFAPFVIIRRG